MNLNHAYALSKRDEQPILCPVLVDKDVPFFRISDNKTLSRLLQGRDLELYHVAGFVPWRHTFHAYVEYNTPLVYRLKGLSNEHCPGLVDILFSIHQSYMQRWPRDSVANGHSLLLKAPHADDKGERRADY